jgi:hypothetical protein
LHAGSDLASKDREPKNLEDLERHARICPDCREHWVSLRQSRAAIALAAIPLSGIVGASESDASRPTTESLWPEVSKRLPPRRRGAPSVFRAAPDGSLSWRDPKNWALMGLSACVCVMLTLVLQTFPRGGVPDLAREELVPAGGMGAVPVLGPSPLHGPIPLGNPRWSRSLLDDHRLGRVLSELPEEDELVFPTRPE